MKLISLLLLCSLTFGQVVNVTIQDTIQVTVQDSISAEELFIQDIAKKAFEKEAKRQKLTNNLLIVAIVALLIDKFL